MGNRISEFFIEYGDKICLDAALWLQQQPSLEEAWQNCTNPAWMLFAVEIVNPVAALRVRLHLLNTLTYYDYPLRKYVTRHDIGQLLWTAQAVVDGNVPYKTYYLHAYGLRRHYSVFAIGDLVNYLCTITCSDAFITELYNIANREELVDIIREEINPFEELS